MAERRSPIRAFIRKLTLAPLLLRLLINRRKLRDDRVSVVHPKQASGFTRRAMRHARQTAHEAFMAALCRAI
ncbi:MAG TPA: hypothetical protein VNZ53_52465 [Steroidobacteraceae bacterium]|nr:hypothetical protein [Steroidobacteraceae bacterium]